MTLFLISRFPSLSITSYVPSPSLFCSLKPISSSTRRKPISATTIPARDRIIDFGKHKGKMLGTLPSKYLKWVSKNLRARDFEEWAKLADEVLQDPVYRDRLEWELAEKILNGDGSSVVSRTESPVSDLLEISERFGWDNGDKIAWSRIDFALLGTSQSGRIPRNRSKKDLELKRENDLGFLRKKSGNSQKELNNPSRETRFGYLGKESMVSKTEKIGSVKTRKVGFLRKGIRVSIGEEEERGFDSFEEEDNSVRMKREERRERQRLKRAMQMQELRRESIGREDEEEDTGIRFQENQNCYQDRTAENNYSPFPGREALLRKVLNRRKVL